jgi:uncharacterized membrane protein YdjX (TVP38/TMEM64 family)
MISDGVVSRDASIHALSVTMIESKKLKWSLVLLAAAAAGLIIAAKYFHGFALLEQMLAWIKGLGIWGPIFFVLVYILATIVFIPGSILTLGAGVLFGVVKGSICVSIASTVSATGAFLIGRYLARDWVSQKIQGKARFVALDKAVAAEGWKIVGLVRLLPFFPFALVSYGFGLTRISLPVYVLASWIGMMPATVVYVYFGSLAQDLTTLNQGVQSPPILKWALGIVTVLATIFITRFARRALAEKMTF